ncbi:hypothetical protein [Halorubrum sp. SD683]|uniref:hypothetical protein n=1 Tax=Halorubrum sp. SD683 TaxID=1855873 RepID=UPI000A2E95A8|nr:hypothetical protein [Halorubrum sp. SD683]OTE99118.1 hypothetical protein B9G49_13425 [Halorubrum sp. SD683]
MSADAAASSEWELLDDCRLPSDLLDDHGIPKVRWERSSTGGRLSWWPTRARRKVALFRTITDDGVTVLQDIYEIRTTQRGEPRSERVDDPQLDEVPDPLLRLVEADGLTVATEGHR